MSNAAHDDDATLDFDELIRASALESAQYADSTLSPSQAPLINHPIALILIWCASLLIGALSLAAHQNEDDVIGQRSGATRLGVALYHVAHRVETYRQFTGSLPDYLEPQWHEAGLVEYTVIEGRYQLIAREGDLVMTYRQGESAGQLLFVGRSRQFTDLSRRATRQLREEGDSE
jgi:hypothetical protein